MPNTTIRALLLSALATLSACATYAPKPVDLDENASILVRRSLLDQSVREVVDASESPLEEWPPASWTPRLLNLAALALNPSLEVARAESNAARASIRTASEVPNPALSAGIEHKSEATTLSPWISSFVLGVSIEALGKRNARVDHAIAIEAAAKAEVDTAIWSLRSNLYRNLIDLHAADEMTRLVARQLETSRFLVSLVERRVAEGESSRLELDQARERERAIGIRNAELESARRVAFAETSAAIGVSEKALREISLDLSELSDPVPPLPDEPVLRALVLTRRSDVIEAVAEYAAAEADLRGEIRRQFPDLRIGPGFGWDQGSVTWMLSVEAELPLFNRHRGPIAEAVAGREVAGARLLDRQSSVLGDLERAKSSLEGARKVLKRTEEAERDERSRLDAAEQRFSLGSIDRATLARRELAWRTAQLDRAAAEAEIGKRLVDLEDVLQQPISAVPSQEGE